MPSCSFCLKRGIECPGYKSQFDVAWRDQNLVAERSVRRRKNTAERRANQSEVVRTKPPLSWPPNGPRPLPQDFEGYAVNFFLSKYICVPQDPNVQRGFLECLYPIWTQSESTSPLKPAVAAVGFCLLEAWSQIRPGQPSSLSQIHYQEGVAALRNRLMNDDEVGDDILLATLVLDMYENVQSFLSATPNRGPHAKGAIALLEHRNKKAAKGTTSPDLLLGARQHFIGRALSNKEPIPVNAFSSDGSLGSAPKTAGNRQDELNIQVANLEYRAAQLNQADFGRVSSALNVLREATELDQQMLAWEGSSPPDWAPIRVSGDDCIPPSVQKTGLYQTYCDVHKSVFVADRINAHRFGRIKLQVIILSCLDRLNKNSSTAASSTTLDIIQMLVDEFCASVPFHLGDRTSITRIDDKNAQYPHLLGCPVSADHHAVASAFAGFMLTRRLGELLSLRVPLRAGQKQWMGGQLRRVKTVYNVVPQE